MSEGTRSEDYSSTYYNDAHLGGYDNYTWDNQQWRDFFLSVADRIVGMVNPRSALDVGCARGLLVQALVAKDVDARGIDISAHAIDSAHEEVRDRLRVASATKPFDGRFDLITCVEVLEHMSPADAQATLDNIAAATDLVLFSSSPGDHDEPTHVNTHPTAHWAAWFAERGFFRRTDVDVGFLAPWAVLFERADLTVHTLTQRYEQQFARVNTELLEKRQALLEAHRRITSLNEEQDEHGGGTLSQRARLAEQWEAEVLESRRELLASRDHSIGVQAEVGRLNREVLRLTEELKTAQGRTRTLTKRRDALLDRLDAARQRATRARKAAQAANRRADALEQELARARASTPRRIARRLMGRR